MFYGVTHVDPPVRTLSRALTFYVGTLGFERRRAGDGWVELDGGSVALRLVEIADPECRATLRLQVRDVTAAMQALLHVGARPVHAPLRTPQLELSASVLDLDGNRLVLWRELTEDEYGFEPELPTTTQWVGEAEELQKRLLQHVPALFRALARRKVVRVVEELAAETADRRVTPLLVVRGYILASAKVTRYRLHEPLRACGYDPNDFRAEFEA
ncbi:MAG: DUF2621 family protein [Deltaproteobacteria bacterium]|nr:DUF2621 family protein [Deltaproteobacteria bacterium]